LIQFVITGLDPVIQTGACGRGALDRRIKSGDDSLR